MKVYIDCDEVYPVFYLSKTHWGRGREVEVPEEFLEEYQRISVEYDDMQEKLREMFANKKDTE